MKAITFTTIFQANSLNYGEGFGNLSTLKKLTRGNGETYSFQSRQSIRYDIVRLGNEMFDWNLQTVSKEKGTVQFREDVSIENSEEMDFFGYFKTTKGQASDARESVVRITHAISLEPYRSDLDFLNNIGLARRIGEHPNLANIEQHQSYYTYTVTIDLDRIGIDKDIQLPNEERYKRVEQLIYIIQLLNRKIRGRHENQAPMFVIGGVYPLANPFFNGRIQLTYDSKGVSIRAGVLSNVLEVETPFGKVDEYTKVGLNRDMFQNEEELKDLVPEGNAHSIPAFFQDLLTQVKTYYKV